ncbi:GNAT family N-acetyltransferase [Candidatus Bipolaricaulota bacterium]|nr:GNAT family N-acetyltransferase [Candidatus Bipolaricaulota bacterium]
MSALQVRPVNRDLLYEAFMLAFADYAMDSSGMTEQRLLLRMQKNAVDFGRSPGAYDGDNLVGFTLIGIDDWGGRLTAYDAGTGILPAFRGQGLVGRMFEFAIPRLEERGVTQFALEALQDNQRAIRAYEKSGFRIARRLRCFTADLQALRAFEDGGGWEVRPACADEVRALEQDADWLPSFENRLSASTFIPGDVRFLGAYASSPSRLEGCVGVIAYCLPLNWLLTIIVRRSERQRGVGRALLRALAHSIPTDVGHLPILNVDAGDEGMQTFLLRLGFSHLVDQVEMRRTIKRPPNYDAAPIAIKRT